MRKAFIFTLAVVLLHMVLFVPHPDLTVSAAKKENKGKSVKIASEEQADISLTNENYLLEGLVDQVHFYYEVPMDKLKGDNYVYLHVDYSDLLIDGSTLTVSVDDERIKSYRLKGGKKDETFKVPLKGKALERGFHHITVAFYGELSKEMCTNEENPANWLTILSDSYVHLEMAKSFADRNNMLSDYPYPFVQTDKTKQIQGKIVIPNNASNDILSTALQVANYLNEQTVDREPIDIVFEKDVKKIDNHLITIGALGDWEGTLKKHITAKAKDLSADELAIYNDVILTDKGNKQIMVMTAEKDATILSLSPLLTVGDYVKQLTKNNLQIKKLPTLEREKITDKILFKKMSIPDIDLSGVTSQSEFYFYDLPTYVDKTKLAYLHLKMKISKTLLYESEYSHALSELTIYVNGVPHSVSIRYLEEDSDGFYRVALPISETTLQEERIMSIQFAGNGLKEREICVPPSEEKWIFVDDKSYLEYGLVASEEKMADFYEWPRPFVSSQDAVNTLVVLTEEITENTLKQVQQITNGLTVKDKAAPIKVTTAVDVTDEQLQENNVIVLGSLAKWDAWEAEEEDALIAMDKSGTLQVDAFGFLTETAKHVAFIQPSVWNENHILAVFSSVHEGEKSFVSKKLIENLQQKKTHTNIMVETVAGDIFTNEIAEEALDNEPTVDKKEDDAPWMLYVFIGIFILAVIMFIIVLRRMRKRKVNE